MPVLKTPQGIDIHYIDQGEGRPLVFIHGWAMSSRVWDIQADRFRRSRRVIVPDIRGHGLSKMPAGAGFSMKELVSDLTSIFEELSLHRAVLIGWSMGAQIVLEAFPHLRDRIDALVLVGGTPRFSSSDDFEFGLPPSEVRGMKIRLKRNHSRTMDDFFNGLFVEGENRGDHMAPMPEPLPEIALKALEALADADQRHILPTVDLPVLLIHGSKDQTCLPAASRYMAGILFDVELKIMRGCGHAPFMTRPDRFNRILSDFLRKVYGRD